MKTSELTPSWLCACRRVGRFRGFNTGLAATIRRREELKQSQVAARENKVTLFRRYRTGELPDIQRVSMAAFLGPLSMALTPGMPGGTEQRLTA